MFRYAFALCLLATPAFSQIIPIPPGPRIATASERFSAGEFQIGMTLAEATMVAAKLGLRTYHRQEKSYQLEGNPTRSDNFVWMTNFVGPVTDEPANQDVYLSYTSPKSGAVAFRVSRRVEYQAGSGPTFDSFLNASTAKWGGHPTKEVQHPEIDKKTYVWHFNSAGAPISINCDYQRTMLTGRSALITVDPFHKDRITALRKSGCGFVSALTATVRQGVVLNFESNVMAIDLLDNAQVSETNWFRSQVFTPQAPTSSNAAPKL